MELVFGGMLVFGIGYLLLMILGGIGEMTDFGVDGVLDSLGLDALFGFEVGDAAEASGLGCSVIAAFLAGAGAVGLTASLTGWSFLESLLAALVFGFVLARLTVVAMRFLYRQQSESVHFSSRDLIGQSGRVTIDSAPGTTGEIMLEYGEVTKYPVKEADNQPLHRGDIVEIVGVEGRFLQVRKLTG
ncbi:MAG: NfeD family protein [Anaerolineaceae bacterium]|nr:NfeD family protein [Anaerolineaceae bacterium]